MSRPVNIGRVGVADLSVMSENTLLISRGDRARKFGIDCVDVLCWKAGCWDPGGEYVKKLIIRTCPQTVKIKYQIPAIKFFSMELPADDAISGMFVAVDVLFRPIRHEPYDDVIIFRTSAGEFGARAVLHLNTQGQGASYC